MIKSVKLKRERLIPARLFMPVALALIVCASQLQTVSGQEKSKAQPQPKKLAANQKTIKVFNGKDLKGISILKKSYYEDHGKVEVVKGELVINKGLPGSGIAIDPKVIKNLPRMNYEVFLEGKRIEGDDFFCGLTFPINQSYCTMILGGWGGGSIGLSNVDSMSAIENETTEFHDFKNNEWYEIHLVVSEKSIKATLNQKGWKEKKSLFSIDPTEHKFDIWWEQEPARPFGITTWSTKAAFRKIEIRELKSAKNKKK